MYEILSAFQSTRDWRTAFLQVIPVRKADPEYASARLARKRGRTEADRFEAGGVSEASSSQDDTSSGDDNSEPGEAVSALKAAVGAPE